MNLSNVLIPLISDESTNDVCMVLVKLDCFNLILSFLQKLHVLSFESISSCLQKVYDLLIVKDQIDPCDVYSVDMDLFRYVIFEKLTSRNCGLSAASLFLRIKLVPVFLKEFLSMPRADVCVKSIVICCDVELIVELAKLFCLFLIKLQSVHNDNSANDLHKCKVNPI